MIRLFIRFYFYPSVKNYKKLRRALVKRQHAYEKKRNEES
jgi:hypothetical protein